MTDDIWLWLLVRLVIIGVVLAAVLWAARRLVEALPMRETRRRTLQQTLPLFEIVIGGLYASMVMRQVFSGNATIAAIAVMGLLFGALWLARHLLIDLLTGALLRAGGHLQPGDRVVVGDIEGEVRWLALRVIVLQTGTGNEALVPYSQLAKGTVLRMQASKGVFQHTFLLESPGPKKPTARLIKRHAMLCHWTYLGRDPVVRHVDQGHTQVTVFTIDPEHISDVEAAVRTGLTQSIRVVGWSDRRLST